MASSNIEWTDATWNPVTGCTRISAGCDHCYAVGMTARLEGMSKSAAGNATQRDVLGKKYAGLTVLNRNGERHFNGKVRTHDDALPIPLGLKKPARIFVNSMSDLFHKDVPFEFIDKVFAVMALCPQHTFQILTKRPDRMAGYLNAVTTHKTFCPIDLKHDGWEHYSRGRQVGMTLRGAGVPWATKADHERKQSVGHEMQYRGANWPLPNVWLGISIEDQGSADDRVGFLPRVPAAVRFLSCEPLLGPIDLVAALPNDVAIGANGKRGGPVTSVEAVVTRPTSLKDCGIDWVITGGESGGKSRPCDVAWIRSIRDQCQTAGVPVFIKQMGCKPYELSNDGAAVRSWGEAKILPNDGFVQIHLNDNKGGDWNEWPADLRVREFPEVSVRNA